ncbi:MAG: radical SAM protein, partial [Planctomycetes bacterium]|nr:radical SAM protein [Planctomycetota bacterium]
MNLDEFAGRLHWMDDLALVAGTSCLYQVSADARRVLREGGPPPVEIEREWSLLGRLGYWPGTACRQEHPFAQAVINVAHACDMACSYCNVDQGHYRASPTVMSPQMGRRIVRALLSLTRERHLDLSLFGGEPMLAWTTVQAVLDEAASSGRRWYKRIFTNGLLLTPESAEFFRRHDVEVVVSLDGPPEIHDKHRVNHRREGSYERVMRGIDLLKAAGARVRAVATVAAEFMSMRPQIEAFLQERLGSDAPVAAELEDCARRDVYPGGQLQYEADREREQIDAFLEGAA